MIREFKETAGQYSVVMETEYGAFQKYEGGILKRDRHGFFRFHATNRVVLSSADCRALTDKLYELNSKKG